MKYELSKRIIEKYDVKCKKIDPFSFTIDSKKGSINIQYYAGSCGYSWPNSKMEIKEFISTCGNGYIFSKLFEHKSISDKNFFMEKIWPIIKEILANESFNNKL